LTASSASEPPGDAARGLARLRELSPDILAAAVLTRSGQPIASDPAGDWQGAVAGLWAAAEATEATGAGAGPDAARVHIGTEDGEVFAVRDDAYAVVAVTRRFALASLMLADLRALLRDLDAEPQSPASSEEVSA